jgi:hypothetical protein
MRIYLLVKGARYRSFHFCSCINSLAIRMDKKISFSRLLVIPVAEVCARAICVRAGVRARLSAVRADRSPQIGPQGLPVADFSC